jgi:DNA-binding GntR family transcriptional regulator
LKKKTVDKKPMEVEIKGVTEGLVQYLRDKIVTGELKAGQKLNESHLSVHIGVSRPPLREAFRILEHERLVESIPRRGARVTDLSMEDLQHIYGAREMIECYAMDLLGAKGTKDFPMLDSALAAAGALSPPFNGNPKQQLVFYKTFSDFHVKLVESAGNYWLTHLYRAISANLARYQFMYFYIEGAAERSSSDHRKIMDHLKKGLYDGAKDCLRAHIFGIAELLKKRILETKRRENHESP